MSLANTYGQLAVVVTAYWSTVCFSWYVMWHIITFCLLWCHFTMKFTCCWLNMHYGAQASRMSMYSGVNRDTSKSWDFPLGSFQRMTMRFCSCSDPVSLDWILILCTFSLRLELYGMFFFLFLCLSTEGWYPPNNPWGDFGHF